MKTLKYIVLGMLSLATLASCDGFFKLDNYDGPNATVSGKIIDAKTNEPIAIEASMVDLSPYPQWWHQYDQVGGLVVQEQGWDGTADQFWFVRYDGTYTNNLVFAGDYKVFMKKLPCYEPESVDFTLKEGDNTVDFKTLPFGRVLVDKTSFSYDATSKKFTVKVKAELGDATKANTLSRIIFCANTQKFVGASSFNLANNDAGASVAGGFDMATWTMRPPLVPGQEYTLTIDTQNAANAELFKYNTDTYKRPIFVRVGALVNGNGNNSSNLYNLSKTYKISGNNYETVEEVSFTE